MGNIKQQEEIIFEIRKDIFDFEEEKFLSYAKHEIIRIYEEGKQNNEIDQNIKIFKKNSERNQTYKIEPYIDNFSIQFAKIEDYVKEEKDKYIKVYLNIYLYDNVDNNINCDYDRDKYWEEIWICTFKRNTEQIEEDYSCSKCGAPMKYDLNIKKLECEYCGNIEAINENTGWEITEIEVE